MSILANTILPFSRRHNRKQYEEQREETVQCPAIFFRKTLIFFCLFPLASPPGMELFLTMQYFKPGFAQFFRELTENNDSGWFDANRQRYQEEVKIPFRLFTSALIDKLARREPDLSIAPAAAIFRINRDTRFTDNKTPYHLHMAATIAPGGRKNKDHPFFHFELGADRINLVAGITSAGRETLARIRSRIMEDHASFKASIQQKSFADQWGMLRGEKNALLPVPLKTFATKEPYLANRQFYCSADLGAGLITEEGLAEIFSSYFLAAYLLYRFLAEAVKAPSFSGP
jgi:uncharacterized protein (TIGR02453 family)